MDSPEAGEATTGDDSVMVEKKAGDKSLVPTGQDLEPSMENQSELDQADEQQEVTYTTAISTTLDFSHNYNMENIENFESFKSIVESNFNKKSKIYGTSDQSVYLSIYQLC